MTGRRLCESIITTLPDGIRLPGYDRSAMRCGIVHLGIGAFHRAHQAAYIDSILEAGDLRWGIVGASLRSSTVRDQLAPQDGLYTLLERDGFSDRLRIVGSVKNVLVAPDNPDRLIQAMANPDVQIVTLTVTEKGYKLDPSSGALLIDDPVIQGDLAHPDTPASVPGLLVAAIKLRKARGLAPFTVISCDNLPENGTRVAGAVSALAGILDPALRDWMERFGAFPNTMVDRIVPATAAADRNAVANELGVDDHGVVKAEPFSQWVIEDHFAGERPNFESVGVQMTDDVRPWEMAKLRLLNGAHSAIAYLGGLAGVEFVHEVMARPAFVALVECLWDEAQVTLGPAPPMDVPTYRVDLMSRLTNSALSHQTRQIAADGSQKIPQRFLEPIAFRLRHGLPIDTLALGVAAWIRWQRGVDEQGTTYNVEDPLAEFTRAVWRHSSSIDTIVDRFLSLQAVFRSDLAENRHLRTSISTHLSFLMQQGSQAAVEQFLK